MHLDPLDSQPAPLSLPCRNSPAARLAHAVGTSLRESTQSTRILQNSRLTVHRYTFMWHDCRAEVARSGCIRRVVYARDRLNGAIRRLAVLRRDDAPPDPPNSDPDPDPVPPPPPATPLALRPRDPPPFDLGVARRHAA